ncbi:hypothetical protein [Catenulispora rubra]|uniref:hypothetical protein n=1 Tax=Catenulispora rubra TaxID=280293 RepID=UPI0018927967|nr:hypothetical protein [Catenulispora rubra]
MSLDYIPDLTFDQAAAMAWLLEDAVDACGEPAGTRFRSYLADGAVAIDQGEFQDLVAAAADAGLFGESWTERVYYRTCQLVAVGDEGTNHAFLQVGGRLGDNGFGGPVMISTPEFAPELAEIDGGSDAATMCNALHLVVQLCNTELAKLRRTAV